MLRLELAEASPDDPDVFAGLATTFNNIASASRSGEAGNPVLPLYQRAVEFARESLRLRPNDASTASVLRILSGNVAALSLGCRRGEEAIAETRASVETLRTLARANPEAPAIQDAYLRSSLDLAYSLTTHYKTEDAGSFADTGTRRFMSSAGAGRRVRPALP